MQREAVGVTTLLPAANQNIRSVFTPEGYVPPKGAGLNITWAPEVMGNYFQPTGIPILRGRAFTVGDNATAPLVVIINHALAKRYWPGQNPIGKRLHRGSAEATTIPWLTVVGEIGDVKELAVDVPSRNQIYFLSSQMKASAGPLGNSASSNGA